MKLPRFFYSFTWRKALLWTLAGLGVTLATVAAMLLLLPTLLSSTFVQQRLHPHLEAALGRTVSWEKLDLSWREGVRLIDLRLGDGEAPLRRLHIEVLESSFGLRGSDIRPLQLSFDLRLSGLTAELEPPPAEDAATVSDRTESNPEEILAEMAARLQGALDLVWDLPVDVRLRIDAGPLAVRYHDPGSGETALVEELHFALHLPSLLTAPINLTAAGAITANDQRLPPFDFSTSISGLADIDGRLRPATARVDLRAELPGLAAELQGTLAGEGLAGGVRLQPAQLLPLVQPFVAEPLPQVTGILSATVASEIVNDGDLLLRMGVQGEVLTASGGPLEQRRIGPLSFTLTQQVATDHRRDTVVIEGGQLLIPELLEAHWQGSALHPLSPNRQLTAQLGPLSVQLPALLTLAQPFLPAELPLTSLDGRLELDAVTISVVDGGQRGDLSLRGLRLYLERLAAKLPDAELTARDLRLELSSAELPLLDFFPSSAQLKAAWQLGSLRMQGEQPLHLADLVGRAAIAVDDLLRQPTSRFGVTAQLTIAQQLSLASLRLPGLIELSGIEETLQLGVRADAQGDLHVDLASFTLLAQGRPTVDGKQLPPFRLDAQAQGAKVRLTEKEALPHVTDLRLGVRLDPGVQLETLAELAPERGGTVRSEGRLAVDAGALASWARALLPAGVGGQGLIDAAWQVRAKLPGPDFPAPTVLNPLQQVRDALDLLNVAELTLNVKDGALRLGGLSPLMASGMHTPTPLRFSWHPGEQRAAVELVAVVERLTGLPGVAADFPPQQLRLALQGEERGLSTAYLTEELRMEPAGLRQVAELVVERLDRLADLPGAPTPADLLRHLNASLFATLDLRLPDELPTVAAPLRLAGNLAGALRVDLEGGKELRIGAFGDLHDLDLRLPDGPEVDGLNLRLAFNRRYAIGSPQQAVAVPPWLSETVLDSRPVVRTLAAPQVTERLWQDLRGVSARERSLTFGRARAQVAGLPIELSDGEGALQLDGSQLGINYLQTGLLGGSLRARAGLDLTSAVPRVELLCAFSGLDIARLLPERVAGEGGAASQITGELALQLPLLADSRQLLEQLDLRLHLWQIGSRTLERALFALDPYEQNEAIIEQRKMLRMGSLRRLLVTAADGGLSTTGEIVVGGVTIALPRIDRLNLASLPLEAKLAEPLKSLPPLLKMLDLATANYLEIGDDGSIALRRMGDGL